MPSSGLVKTLEEVDTRIMYDREPLTNSAAGHRHEERLLCLCPMQVQQGVTWMSAVSSTVGVLMIVVASVLTARGGDVRKGTSPSPFTLGILLTMGALCAGSGLCAFHTLYANNLLSFCSSAAEQGAQAFHALKPKDLYKMRAMAYALHLVWLLYLFHFIMEVARGNPNFKAGKVSIYIKWGSCDACV